MGAAYVLDDPRPIAARAPYTYYLPSDALVAAVEPGDSVKLLFRRLAESPKYDVERMWVRVQLVSDDRMVGVLDNKPFDMPGLERGECVLFERHHVIDVQFADPEKDRIKNEPRRRQYWDRCLVDRCVLDDGVPVGFIYREEPSLEREGDEYPDSGWCIRGDARGLSDDEIDARESEYVAIGAVLNRDDSWLPVINEPAGSAFLRDFATNTFERQTDLQDD